jgi:hypothetical protein
MYDCVTKCDVHSFCDASFCWHDCVLQSSLDFIILFYLILF